MYTKEYFDNLHKKYSRSCKHFLTSLYVEANLAGLCIECGYHERSHNRMKCPECMGDYDTLRGICATCKYKATAADFGRTISTSIHPIQTVDHKGGKLAQVVTLRAYEVYCKVYGAQEAMITGGCRGGFSTGELIAFLYARSFPPEEWRARVDEAFKGMEHI